MLFRNFFSFDMTPFPLLFFRGGEGVNLWLTTRYLSLFTCSTIMVFFLFRSLSLSLIPIFPAISFIFSLINNSSQFVLGLISSFREFSSECFLPGEIRKGFHPNHIAQHSRLLLQQSGLAWHLVVHLPTK